jgi:endonuclease-3
MTKKIVSRTVDAPSKNSSVMLKGPRRKGRESIESKQKRGKAILARLDQEFPNPETALIHRNAFELLIATILSAQCTDERVNKVTPALFASAPTPQAMVKLGVKEIESHIKSVNFFRNKAKNLYACSEKLLAKHKGEVPRTREELVELPGVGRKTANVVLGSAFDTPGMVVDTHVQRLSNRLGLVREMDPVKIELQLEKIFPTDRWVDVAHLLILHGRKTCKAVRPLCERCILVDLCPSAFKAPDSWRS